MNDVRKCPVCGSLKSEQIVALRNLPVVCNHLLRVEHEARKAPSADIDLVVCEECSMIWNTAFQSEAIPYAPGYDNALHFSAKFREFANSLIGDLVRKYALGGAIVFEVGCGDGYILDLLAKHGVAKAIGFDPSMSGRTTLFEQKESVEIIPEFFRKDAVPEDAGLVICRHVLEHIESPIDFLSSVHEATGGKNIPIYFEVPNGEWIMESVSIWDIIYEHFSYWTLNSINAAFRRAGFEVVSVSETYDRQFLSIEAKPGGKQPMQPCGNIANSLQRAKTFSKAVEGFIAHWRQRVAAAEGNVLIWGAGSKGITFANLIGEVEGPIKALIDLNPRKQGLFIPGLGVPVIAPSDLETLAPELVLVANPTYLSEVEGKIGDMGCKVHCEAIL